MRKWILSALCAGLMMTGTAAMAQEMDPLLKLLVENKVITEDQAKQVQEQYAKQQKKEQEATEKIAKDVVKKETKGLEGIKFEGLWYLSYQNGKAYRGTADETSQYSQFRVKRGYLTIKKEFTPWFEGRFTPDITQDSTGDYKLRMKYLYAKFKWRGNAFISKPYTEIGLAHMPWLDFEEHIDFYRMQDTMFMERNGLFNSADLGILVGSNFGPDLPKEYTDEVSHYYTGRWGSWQAGIFNGGGYHASEKNNNKVIQARVTVRPLPDYVPGLQLSGFYVDGKGNVSEPEPGQPYPDWIVKNLMLSYESKYWVFTGQWYEGEGNQAGTAVFTDGPKKGESLPKEGYSFFTEVRFPGSRKFSVIGRYDHFNPNTDDPRSDIQNRTIFGVAYTLYKERKNVILLDYEQLDHRDPNIPKEDRVQLTLQVAW